MENGKKKNSVTIMLVISLIVIVLGFICGVCVYYEVTSQVAASSGLDGGLYIDGSDFSGLVDLLGQAGAFILSAVIVGASFFAVGIQWFIYFIVKLIKNHLAKNNQPQTYMNNDRYI